MALNKSKFKHDHCKTRPLYELAYLVLHRHWKRLSTIESLKTFDFAADLSVMSIFFSKSFDSCLFQKTCSLYFSASNTVLPMNLAGSFSKFRVPALY